MLSWVRIWLGDMSREMDDGPGVTGFVPNYLPCIIIPVYESRSRRSYNRSTNRENIVDSGIPGMSRSPFDERRTGDSPRGSGTTPMHACLHSLDRKTGIRRPGRPASELMIVTDRKDFREPVGLPRRSMGPRDRSFQLRNRVAKASWAISGVGRVQWLKPRLE